MERSTRTLLLVATGVAMAVLGLFLGRNLRGAPEAADQPPTILRVAEAGVLGEIDASVPAAVPSRGTDGDDRLIPVIAPVHVSDDGLFWGNLDAEAAPAGTPGLAEGVAGVAQEPRIVGAVPAAAAFRDFAPAAAPDPDTEATPDSDTEPTADPAPEGPPETDAEILGDGPDTGTRMTFIPLFGWRELPFDLLLRLIDPCAGMEPGATPPEGCPEGTGATVLATLAPPDPFAFFSGGHVVSPTMPGAQVCPSGTAVPAAPGQAAMTLWSRTPLVSVSLQIRPHGSSQPWQDLDVALSSTPEQTAGWNAMFAEQEEWSLEWGTLPHCFLVERDDDMAYDLAGVAVDVFDRVITLQRGLIRVERDTRPPTVGRLNPDGPSASIHAYTVEGGFVAVAHRVLDVTSLDDLGRDGGPSLDCSSQFGSAVRGSGGFARPPANPAVTYDPAYNQHYPFSIPMPVGGVLHACVFIHDSDNPVRPLVIDSLVFAAPAQQNPRVVFQGVRRWGEETVDQVVVSTGDVRNGCSVDVGADNLTPDRAHTVERVVWECVNGPLNAHAGVLHVPVRMTRSIGTNVAVEEMALRLELDDCATEPCRGRPREWYEVPIPTTVRRMCGTGWGSEGCSGPSGAGVVVLRVEYPVADGVAAEAGGEVLDLGEVEPTLREGTPRLAGEQLRFVATGDPFFYDGVATFFTDRPVRPTLVLSEDVRSTPICYSGPLEIPWEGEPSTDFSFDLSGLCAGMHYSFYVWLEDDDGERWLIRDRPSGNTPGVRATYHAQIELLGGPREFGYIYRIGVTIDGQIPTAYWYDKFAPRVGSHPSCVLLDGTRFNSRHLPPAIRWRAPDLYVTVTLHVTTMGDGDCDGRPSGIDQMMFDATFSTDEIRDAEVLVLESPEDSPFRMRVTLTRETPWRVG